MNRRKLTGSLLILGAVLFLTPSFLPTVRVYMEPSPEARLEIIRSVPQIWAAAQLLYFGGAVITCTGIFLAVVNLPRQRAYLLPLSAVFFGLATVFLTGYIYPRWVNPEGWAFASGPNLMFLTYSFLIQAGLLLFGLALLESGLPRWLGILTASSAILLIILTVVFRDMVPDVYYLLTLIPGIFLAAKRNLHLNPPIRVA